VTTNRARRSTVIPAVLFLLATTCAKQASESPASPSPSPPVGTVSIQIRPVIAVADPSSSPSASVQPVCDDLAGCPGIEIPADEKMVAKARAGALMSLAPAVVTEIDIASAEAYQSQPTNGWVINVALTPSGTNAFTQATTLAVTMPSPRNQLAIVVDGIVVSAPVVQNPITGGSFSVYGGFTQQEANDLVAKMNHESAPSASGLPSATAT